MIQALWATGIVDTATVHEVQTGRQVYTLLEDRVLKWGGCWSSNLKNAPFVLFQTVTDAKVKMMLSKNDHQNKCFYF